MKLQKLLSLTLVAVACFTFTACSDDGSDDNADMSGDGDGDGDGDSESDSETGPSGDATCADYCVAFITFCIETGMSTDFASNDECQSTCEGWAQADLQCRYDQVQIPECAEAGVNSSTCGG